MAEEKHLFFLVHGLMGNPRHMQSISECLSRQFKLDGQENIIVSVATGNAGLNTFDGVPLGAERLFRELMDKIGEIGREGGKVTKISFVGYSLGGLFSRYLIGILQDIGFFDDVEPVIFTTFATPHVGSKFHSSRFRARILNFFGNFTLGLAGYDLFGSSSLLNDMADPDGRYFKGLERFKELLLFANVVNDRTVPYWTSYLTYKNPFRDMGHVDIAYHDHSEEDIGSGDCPKAAPFIVDMTRSRFLKTRKQAAPLTAMEKRVKLIQLFILPLLLPVLVAALSITTAISLFKHYLLKRDIGVGHKALYKAITAGATAKTMKSAQNVIGDSVVSDQDVDSYVAKATSAAVEYLDNAESADPSAPAERREKSSHTPALAASGTRGLLDSTPYELRLSADTRQQVDNLNKLPWQKYAVHFQYFNTHQEIVNRRQKQGEGYELQKFYARLCSRLLTTNA